MRNHNNTMLAMTSAILWIAGVDGGHAQVRTLDAAYLDAIRGEVRTNHPSMAAIEARMLAADAGVRAVRLWEDPVAGTGFMAADREMRMNNGDMMLGIEQMLPRKSLYEARRQRAAADRSALGAEARSTALMLETSAGLAAVELALADDMIAIEREQWNWLRRMHDIAMERVKDPQANASEALRLESELAMQKQRIDTLLVRRKGIERQLNILLGREIATPWEEVRLPVDPPGMPALQAELSRLYAANPMLEALLHSVEAAEAEIRVARGEQRPVFSVGLDNRAFSGGEFSQTTIAAKMSLPWFNKPVYQAAIDRAQKTRFALEKEVETLDRRLRGEAVAAHTAAETSARQAATIATDVLPSMTKAVESTRNVWISSRASVLEVLDAQRSLLGARIEERRAVAAQRAALETLRSIVPPAPNQTFNPQHTP